MVLTSTWGRTVAVTGLDARSARLGHLFGDVFGHRNPRGYSLIRFRSGQLRHSVRIGHKAGSSSATVTCLPRPTRSWRAARLVSSPPVDAMCRAFGSS